MRSNPELRRIHTIAHSAARSAGVLLVNNTAANPLQSVPNPDIAFDSLPFKSFVSANRGAGMVTLRIPVARDRVQQVTIPAKTILFYVDDKGAHVRVPKVITDAVAANPKARQLLITEADLPIDLKDKPLFISNTHNIAQESKARSAAFAATGAFEAIRGLYPAAVAAGVTAAGSAVSSVASRLASASTGLMGYATRVAAETLPEADKTPRITELSDALARSDKTRIAEVINEILEGPKPEFKAALEQIAANPHLMKDVVEALNEKQIIHTFFFDVIEAGNLAIAKAMIRSANDNKPKDQYLVFNMLVPPLRGRLEHHRAVLSFLVTAKKEQELQAIIEELKGNPERLQEVIANIKVRDGYDQLSSDFRGMVRARLKEAAILKEPALPLELIELRDAFVHSDKESITKTLDAMLAEPKDELLRKITSMIKIDEKSGIGLLEIAILADVPQSKMILDIIADQPDLISYSLRKSPAPHVFLQALAINSEFPIMRVATEEAKLNPLLLNKMLFPNHFQRGFAPYPHLSGTSILSSFFLSPYLATDKKSAIEPLFKGLKDYNPDLLMSVVRNYILQPHHPYRAQSNLVFVVKTLCAVLSDDPVVLENRLQPLLVDIAFSHDPAADQAVKAIFEAVGSDAVERILLKPNLDKRLRVTEGGYEHPIDLRTSN